MGRVARGNDIMAPMLKRCFSGGIQMDCCLMLLNPTYGWERAFKIQRYFSHNRGLGNFFSHVERAHRLISPWGLEMVRIKLNNAYCNSCILLPQATPRPWAQSMVISRSLNKLSYSPKSVFEVLTRLECVRMQILTISELKGQTLPADSVVKNTD